MNLSSGSESSPPISASAPPLEYLDSNSHSPLTLTWISVSIKTTTQTTIPPTIPFMNNTQLTPLTIHLATLETSERHSHSVLDGLNSEVLFYFPSLLSSCCLWTVWKQGTPFPVHREIAQLNLYSSPKHSSGWNYSARLVPGFWSTLCNDPCKSFSPYVQAPLTLNHRSDSIYNDPRHLPRSS